MTKYFLSLIFCQIIRWFDIIDELAYYSDHKTIFTLDALSEW